MIKYKLLINRLLKLLKRGKLNKDKIQQMNVVHIDKPFKKILVNNSSFLLSFSKHRYFTTLQKIYNLNIIKNYRTKKARNIKIYLQNFQYNKELQTLKTLDTLFYRIYS